jgi:cardiolipin synthase
MGMFKNAENDIIIMSSYFIPGSFFKKNIIKALNRGVNIKLILAGMSDVGIAKYAEKYLYRWAIRHGIEIYEYKHNVLHGKIAVSDKTFVTAGSYNINDISALASVELNLDIQEKAFATHVDNVLRDIIINECVKFFNTWNKQIMDPILWPTISMRCKKFVPFMEYDKDKYCHILRDKFSQS